MASTDDDPGAPAPRFVNPDAPVSGAPRPSFVKPGGERIFTPAASAPGEGPLFVQPGAPGEGPVFVQPGAPGATQGGPVFVQPGGPQGGPVFVKPDSEGEPLDAEHPWPWWLGPVAVVVAIFGIVPAQLGLAAMIAAIQGGGGTAIIEDNTHWFGLLQDVAWIGIVLVLPYLVVKYLRPEQLGMSMSRATFGRSIGVLVAAAVAFYVLAALYSAALGLTEDQNTLLSDTGFGDSVLKDAIFALLFTVAAPVAEELLFRGLLFRTLRDGLSRRGPRFGVWGGAIISGVLFGGIHFGGGQDDFLPVLMLLGIVLALAYHWSGTIYVPIAIHAFNNAMATGFNSDPKADWIYGLIFGGPILALGLTYLLSRFIRRVFPSERPTPAEPPSGIPATL